MTTPPVLLSIIICAYTLDRWEDICEAIASARLQDHPASEIILVSDHNLELELKARAAFPDVIVLANQEQVGLSGARNTGVAAARGEIVAFLDDDATAHRHWATHLLSGFDASSVAGVVPLIEPRWLGQRPSWFPSEFMWVVGCSYRGMTNERQIVRNVLGGACAFRRSLFEKTGGFNHRLGRTKSKILMSCEETEFCIRAKQMNPETAFVFLPDAVVYHKVRSQRLTWRYFTHRCYAEGLSKAYLAQLVGFRYGLSAERTYVWRTLSTGFAKAIADAVFQFDVNGLGRAFAMVWGLSCASAGYVWGSLSALFKVRIRSQKSESEQNIEAAIKARH